MTTQPFTPDVAAIVADLRNDQIHIDSTIPDAISAAQLKQIKVTIDGSSIPMYVIATPLTSSDQLTPVQLVSLVHRTLPEDGVWFVAKKSYDDTWELNSTTYGVKTDNAHKLASYVARDLYPADLGLQLQEATELIASGTARTVYEELNPYSSTPTTSTSQGDGAQLFGIDLPLALTGLGLVLVLAIVPLLRKRRAGAHEIAVRNRTLRRISTAQADNWRHRAENETETLGNQINSRQIAADSDRAAWAAALDHYEAANRVLDRTSTAADSIGALVLARRGHDALTHAVKGEPWAPTAVCFFNPLHGNATATVRWKTASGSRDVPCCADCRRIVRKRREPDFLDLPVGDTVVHYVDADAEPWSSSGFGSLNPDLLSHLREL